jgi:hypothetical protein
VAQNQFCISAIRRAAARHGRRSGLDRGHRDTLRILTETGTPLAYAIGVPTFGQGNENANLNENDSHSRPRDDSAVISRRLQMRMRRIRIWRPSQGEGARPAVGRQYVYLPIDCFTCN